MARRSRDAPQTVSAGGSIKSWSDEQIAPGSQWFGEIKSALAKQRLLFCWLPLIFSPQTLFMSMNSVRY